MPIILSSHTFIYIFPCGRQPIQSDWYLTYYEEKQSQPESAISEKMSYIAYMNQQKAYCELQSAAAESKYGSKKTKLECDFEFQEKIMREADWQI